MAVFTKPAITLIEQIALLKQRGLILSDEAQVLSVLNAVSFFRLTPYMRPFQLPGHEHHFKPNGNHSPQSAPSGRFAVMKQVERNFL